MSIATQFYLLQYKNWKLQFRRKLVTVFEILLPALFCLLTVSLRTLVEVDEFKEPILYEPYSVESMPKALIDQMNPVYPLIGLAYTPKTNLTETVMGKVGGRLINIETGPSWVLCKYIDGTLLVPICMSSLSLEFELRILVCASSGWVRYRR